MIDNLVSVHILLGHIKIISFNLAKAFNLSSQKVLKRYIKKETKKKLFIQIHLAQQEVLLFFG